MGEDIWQEPVRGGVLPPHLLGRPGVEQLRAFLSGEAPVPPIGYLTGLYPTEFGVGSATFVMPVTGWLNITTGLMTAGGVAILADAPLGCAVQTVLPPVTGYTTAELSINLVRPVPAQGRLLARGRLVHAGRRLGLSEVHVTDDAGRLIAHGTSRCVIFPPAADVPAPGPPGDETSPENEAEAGWAPPYTRAVQGSVLAQEVFDQRGGLDVVRGLIDGDLPLPPASYLLGARPIGAEEGSCTFSMPASPWFISPLGSIEGGVIACLADFSLGAAMHTTLPPGTTVAPTDLRAQFIRPVPADGRQVTARAGVVHRGRSLVAARAEVLNEEGKLLALASASGLVLAGSRADLASAAPLG